MAIRVISRQWRVTCCALLMLELASGQPSTDPGTFDALSTAIEGFGSTLVTQLPNSTATKGNFVSPASISLALGLLLAGATSGTPTYGQLQELLGGTTEAAVGKGLLPLKAAQAAIRKDASADVVINLANAVYVKPPRSFSPAYTSAVASAFNATAQELVSAQQVNSFVATATKGRIPTIVSQELVEDPSTIALLVNAVYFKGKWQTKFDPASTALEPFTKLGGTRTTVPTMVQTAKFALAQDPRFTAIELPYIGQKFRAIAVLPALGVPMSEAIAAASEQELPYTSTKVELHLPKFTLENQYELKPYLRAQGLTAPFEPSHDLDSMLAPPPPPEGMFISHVLHRVFIQVDEAGTEAAAATAVGVSTTSFEPPVPPVVLKFNRLFAFGIVHMPTQISMFLGEVFSPA